MNEPRLRAESPPEQAPLAPGSMTLVAEWVTPERDRMELYAGSEDGRLVAIGPYGAETAADITEATSAEPKVLWCGRLAKRGRPWHNIQTGIVRARLAERS